MSGEPPRDRLKTPRPPHTLHNRRPRVSRLHDALGLSSLNIVHIQTGFSELELDAYPPCPSQSLRLTRTPTHPVPPDPCEDRSQGCIKNRKFQQNHAETLMIGCHSHGWLNPKD